MFPVPGTIRVMSLNETDTIPGLPDTAAAGRIAEIVLLAAVRPGGTIISLVDIAGRNR